MSIVDEAAYPISFHNHLSTELGKHLKDRQPVVLIGMKRVGTNNFLRFFLYHPEIIKTYVDPKECHLFIHVDLYDLAELNIRLFWLLTLKRIIEATADISTLNKCQDEFREIMDAAMQTQDVIWLFDFVRSTLQKIIENGVLPTIFFIRFDRLTEIVSNEFFNNLKGLRENTHFKLSFVFTSFRPLEEVKPEVFKPASLYAFCQNLFVKPSNVQDSKIIIEAEKKHYRVLLDEKLEKMLINLAGGYFQYLHLGLQVIRNAQNPIETESELEILLSQDERVNFQSEELLDHINATEQEILNKIVLGKATREEEIESQKYLIETGFIKKEGNKYLLFSRIFENYLKDKQLPKTSSTSDFTGKELLLFNFLKENEGEICDREKIAAAAWPEEELDVTDWAIDRLIGRVRNKIKEQKLPLEIITVKTRGYKLIKS
jgi:hypothetical protein